MLTRWQRMIHSFSLSDHAVILFTGVLIHLNWQFCSSILIFSAKNQLEFCCHMLRGTIDPKEPPVYEYVKFIGNFKSLNIGELYCCIRTVWNLSSDFQAVNLSVLCLSPVPNCTRNGFDGVIPRSLHSAFEDRVCLIATVRLAKPQFIKVRSHSAFYSFSLLLLSDWHTFGFLSQCFKKVVLIRTELNSNGCPDTPGKHIWAPVSHCVQSPAASVGNHFSWCKSTLSFLPAELKRCCWFYVVCWKSGDHECGIKSIMD